MKIMGKIHIYNLIFIYLEASHKDLHSHQFLLYVTQVCALSDSSSNLIGNLFLDNKKELQNILARDVNSHAPLTQITGVD